MTSSRKLLQGLLLCAGLLGSSQSFALSAELACRTMASSAAASGAKHGYRCAIEPAKKLIHAFPSADTPEAEMPAPTWGSIQGFAWSLKNENPSGWELLVHAPKQCFKISDANAKALGASFPTFASIKSDEFKKSANSKMTAADCNYKATPRASLPSGPLCAKASESLTAHGGLRGVQLTCREKGNAIDFSPNTPAAFDKNPQAFAAAISSGAQLAPKTTGPTPLLYFPINGETNPTRCLALTVGEAKTFANALSKDGGLDKAFPKGKKLSETPESSSRLILERLTLTALAHPENSSISTCLGYRTTDVIINFGIAKK